MLSKEDNEYLCRIGPDTPMGNLLRRYWLPALLSSELPEPDCAPVRVRVLGEDLIAFRDSNGQVGLVEQHCPHRGASLFFGRNEKGGLRCVYHGWKYDVSGQCVDMPNEPAESNFKTRIRVTAYPTVEQAGAVWVYMGPMDKKPAFRDFGGGTEASAGGASKVLSWCNYVQAMEGNLDSSHISFLHRNLDDNRPVDDGTLRLGYPSEAVSTLIRATSRAARVEVEETEYGFRYAGIRPLSTEDMHVRMTVFVLPIFTFVANLPWQGRGTGVFVPRDDESCWRFQVRLESGRRPIAGGQPGVFVNDQGQRVRTPENDYLLDREAQRTRSMTGIIGVGNQDYAVTESMGPIYDRSKERLGTTDGAIMKMRQQLIQAARGLERGIEPPGLDGSFPWHRVRSAEKILAAGEDWRLMGTDAEETDWAAAKALGGPGAR